MIIYIHEERKEKSKTKERKEEKKEEKRRENKPEQVDPVTSRFCVPFGQQPNVPLLKLTHCFCESQGRPVLTDFKVA